MTSHEHLEMNLHVNAHLERHTTLGRIDGLTGSSATESEGSVFCVCDVTGPKVNVHASKVGSCMSSKYGIQLLREGVGIIPPNLALAIHVGTYRDILQHGTAEIETVISHCREGVGWNEWNIVVLIVSILVNIFLKLGIGIAIVGTR